MAIFILVGNTNLKAEVTPGFPVSLPLADFDRALGSLLPSPCRECVVIAGVNPPAEDALRRSLERAGVTDGVFAGRDFPTGVELDVEKPDAVGVDRILNVRAAFARVRTACAAVDFGTAVSISVADGKGRFVGGAILPGVALSLDSLARGTALLPRIAPGAPSSPLGRDTVAAMTSGCVFGAAGAVKEIISRMASAMQCDLRVFSTGGDAALMEALLPAGWSFVPALTLEGLRLAYEQWKSTR